MLKAPCLQSDVVTLLEAVINETASSDRPNRLRIACNMLPFSTGSFVRIKASPGIVFIKEETAEALRLSTASSTIKFHNQGTNLCSMLCECRERFILLRDECSADARKFLEEAKGSTMQGDCSCRFTE